MKRNVKWATANKKWALSMMLVLSVSSVVSLTGCRAVPKLLEPIGTDANLVTVSRGEMYNIDISNTTVIPETYYVRMKGQGIVKGIPVFLGDTVKEGDILIEIDGGELSNQIETIDEQIAAMEKSNAYLNALTNYQIQIAELELQKLKASGASVEEVESKTYDLNRLKDKLNTDIVEQEKEMAELQLTKLEGGASGTPVKAPCNGTVVALNAGEVGDIIEDATVVAAVAVEGSKILKGDYIAEEELEAAHEYYALIGGKRYEITPSPYSDSELSLLTMFESTLYGTYYLNNNEDIDCGAMAMVVMITDYKENALYIPDNALYNDVDSYYVYVEGPEGEKVRRDVEIGIQWDTAVEILSGLEEGEILYAK